MVSSRKHVPYVQKLCVLEFKLFCINITFRLSSIKWSTLAKFVEALVVSCIRENAVLSPVLGDMKGVFHFEHRTNSGPLPLK